MEELAWDYGVSTDQDELQKSAAKEIGLVNDVFIDQNESQLLAKEVALVDLDEESETNRDVSEVGTTSPAATLNSSSEQAASSAASE